MDWLNAYPWLRWGVCDSFPYYPCWTDSSNFYLRLSTQPTGHWWTQAYSQ